MIGVCLVSGGSDTKLPTSVNWVPLSSLARRVRYRVEPLADELGVTTRYFNSLFVSSLGIGVKRWLRDLRALDAIQALSEGASWDEAAERVGFSHRRKLHQEILHFTRMHWRDFEKTVRMLTRPLE